MENIRIANKNDIPAIAEIYDRIIDSSAPTGWVKGVYPTASSATKALEKGHLFVYEEDGKILASAVINKEQVDVYSQCKWTLELPCDEVMVLHTLTVDPLCSGKGIGRKFVSFYEEFARKNSCRALRMDTNQINTAARGLYAKLGFKEVGIVPCTFNGIEGIGLVCLEKVLD